MNKGAAFKRRWLEGAKAISALYLSLSQAPFEQYEREFLGLQRKLLATSARTEWEQKETRRRIAEEILLGAWSLNSPWEDFGRALRRIRRLGYSNVERRFHVALLLPGVHPRGEGVCTSPPLSVQGRAALTPTTCAIRSGSTRAWPSPWTWMWTSRSG